jgi:phosphoribosylformylglycinamidine synthase II
MIYRIDVINNNEVPLLDLGLSVRELGIEKSLSAYFRKVYFLDADLDKTQIDKLAQALLIDIVVERFTIASGFFATQPNDDEILITFNPGVCDNIALSLDKAINDLNIKVKSTRTGRYYRFEGLDSTDIAYIAPKILYNPLIEHLINYAKAKNVNTLDEFAGKHYEFSLLTVDMLTADDNSLMDISKRGCLSLSLGEMKVVQGYFRRLKRNPTDCELETIAASWSEHCCHKTFRGIIDYEEKNSDGVTVKKEKIDNLLKTTVMKATKDINSTDCISVFHDNSGVVRFDEKNNICFKVETHNHPSSLEPYGGASTGIGGVIRDILGTGCAAKPFASTDVFCFSPWDIQYKDLPPGLLHPKRIISGVVSGVRDYGNRMGIPTIAGAVLFDERFLGNPLVYCGTMGIMPKEKSLKYPHKGDMVIVCGAKTGRDGIHGATFSSKELDEETVGLTSAVQIGNAIEEKKLTEAIIRARDKDLFNAITDCGAGGICSAIPELAAEWGVEVSLNKVPLKYKGLSYTEIWISESQERMVMFTDERNLPALKDIFDEEEVGMAVVGVVTETHKLVLKYDDVTVCDLDLDFLFNPPKLEKKAVWRSKTEKAVECKERESYGDELKALLASPNIACKDWVLRQYDHEVQAGSVLKSIGSVGNMFVSNGSIVRPDLTSDKCVAVGMGINPFYSDIDPYEMAALSIEEALRNIAAMGGRLDKTYILDNFSWGSPLDEEVLGGLVRACKACYDFATYYRTPFISGKDSLYNEYTVGQKRIVIPGTLLISAMTVMDSADKIVTAPFKKSGNLLYLLGVTKSELGCSEYYRMKKISGGILPRVDKAISLDIFNGLAKAMDKFLVKSCHDLSEGGLAVAAAEMAIGSGLGANIFLSDVRKAEGIHDCDVLFSESSSRFLVEVDKAHKDEFETLMKNVPMNLVGCVSDKKDVIFYGAKNKELIHCGIDTLFDAWTKTFKQFRYNK